MEAKEDYLLQLTEHHLNKVKEVNNQNFMIDYRVSTFAIVNYYNLLMLRVGKELNKDVKESFEFDKKLFIISQELPELLTKYESLFSTIKKLRDTISHTDISIPNKNKIIEAVGQAKGFKTYLSDLVIKRKKEYTKRIALKEEYKETYKEKMGFIKLWFEHYDKRSKKKNINQSEKIKDLFDKLELYGKIKLERLDTKSIKSLLYLLNITLKEAELIYESIYSYCPKCGGNIIVTTESETQYTGPYDDPEPHSYTVWQVVKCEKCGEIFEREHITTESI